MRYSATGPILFAALVCLYPGAQLQAQTTLNLSSATANPGTTITLGLSLTTTGSGPSGLQWTFTYSPNQITGISLSPGPVATAAGKFVTCASASGSSACMVTGLNSQTIASGVVAYVSVTLAPSATTTAVAISNPTAVDRKSTR